MGREGAQEDLHFSKLSACHGSRVVRGGDCWPEHFCFCNMWHWGRAGNDV